VHPGFYFTINVMTKRFGSIVCIGDLHCPFLHRPTFEKILKIIQSIEPAYIVFMGDIYDMYAFSKFSKSLRFSPKQEIEEGRSQVEEIVRLIRKASPASEIYMIRGNHDIRAFMRHTEKFGSSFDGVVEFKDLWTFEGVKTMFDPKEVLQIQGISFTHGHLSRLGDHMKSMEYQNVVCGHSHTGGIYYHRISSGEVRWELNVGYVGDPFSPELNYRNLLRYFKWTHGVGLISELAGTVTPVFIPLGGPDGIASGS